MERPQQSKKISLFIVLLTMSVVLIGVSVWLITNVSSKRTQIEQLVGEVGIISAFEVKLTTCLDLSDRDDKEAFTSSISSVLETDFYLEEYPSLTELSERTAELENYFNVSEVIMNFRPFRQDVQEIYDYCIQLKKKKRQNLGMISAELGGYWAYTHILTVVACILFLILSWVIYNSIGVKKNISELQHQNNLFKNNLTDCLMVSNADGLITEVNSVAEKLFGYPTGELIGKSAKILYANEVDYQQVFKALEENKVFQGEVYNKKKSGESFEVFLSANMIYDESGKIIGAMGISRDISEEKKREKRYEYIVDNAGDIIYTTNAEGRVTYVNNSVEALLGYTKREVLGKSFHSLIHPDSLELVIGHYERQFTNLIEDSYLEFKMMKRDGTPIWVGQSVRTSFDPINPERVNGFLGILRDLNEAKKATIKLEESELKYRELFENAKGLIQSIDVSGNILFANEAWKRLLGYSEEDLRNMRIDDMLTPESKLDANRILNEIMKEKSDLGTREEILNMVSKSGEEFTLKGTISLKFDDTKSISELQLFLRDVTAQQKVEQALERSEKNFRQISRSINDVFFLYSLDEKRYEYISESAKMVLGLSQDFFYKGGDFSDKIENQEEKEAYNEAFASVIKGEEVVHRYRITVKGEERWIDERWFPILNDREEIIGVSGVCRDVTAMKEAYDLIYEKNAEIQQSIVYAKNIQESTLPTEEELKSILPNSFIFYQAKDVLSGDLYVVDQIRYKDLIMPTFVVGDCTGHGVPGGVLSLLCSGLLRESLTNKDINTPSQALDFVREKLIGLFRSNPDKYILDGMDAAFCVLNKETKELYFAGANLSCYILRGGEVMEYKGDKQHIGYNSRMEPFVHFNIDVEENDRIYLTTDGFVDQFGGPKNKKFYRKRFIDLLVEMNELPMEEQMDKLRSVFENWKGKNPQTDDVAVMGVELHFDN